MRKLLTGAATAAIATGAAAIALAAPVQHYKQNFAASKSGTPTKRPGKPTGTFFHVDATNATNTAYNKQPPSAKALDLSFPPGAAFDQTALPKCGASKAKLATPT